MIDILHRVKPLVADQAVHQLVHTFWKKLTKDPDLRILSIAWVGARESKLVNNALRGKNMPTNVLSFEHGDVVGVRSSEVILCPFVIRREAKTYHAPVTLYAVRLLVHGLFHTEGVHHDSAAARRAMERRERELMRICGYDDVLI